MDLVNEVAERTARRLVRRDRRQADALPPGPAAPPVTQLLSFLLTPGPFLRACRARYGNCVTLRLPGMAPLVQFSDPEVVREVFATGDDAMHAGKANAILEPFLGQHSVLVLDGPRHRSQRRLLLPPFRGDRMRAYGAAMRDLTQRAMATWPRGVRLSAQREMQGITLDVILRTVFGMDDGADQDRMRALMTQALRIIDNPMFLVRVFQKDLGPRSPWGRFLRLRLAVKDEMAALIARRRREGLGEDVLSMLLEAKHEDGAPMSDDEIYDELATLLVAGHETTATGLSWTLHRLSVHRDVLERVYEELDAVLGDGPFDPDKVRELPYLDAVCKESLRIHPVIPGVGRVLQRALKLGGRELPEGTIVGCSIYLLHSDPTIWPEPERFDPRRFLDHKPTPYTYFPFGGGLRRCIGEAFALYEMRVVLATMLRELEPVAAVPVVREQRRNITITPAGGMPLVFAPRRRN